MVKKGSRFSSSESRRIKNAIIRNGGREYSLVYNNTEGSDTVDIICKPPFSTMTKKRMEYFATVDISECLTANQALEKIEATIKRKVVVT